MEEEDCEPPDWFEKYFPQQQARIDEDEEEEDPNLAHRKRASLFSSGSSLLGVAHPPSASPGSLFQHVSALNNNGDLTRTNFIAQGNSFAKATQFHQTQADPPFSPVMPHPVPHISPPQRFLCSIPGFQYHFSQPIESDPPHAPIKSGSFLEVIFGPQTPRQPHQPHQNWASVTNASDLAPTTTDPPVYHFYKYRELFMNTGDELYDLRSRKRCLNQHKIDNPLHSSSFNQFDRCDDDGDDVDDEDMSFTSKQIDFIMGYNEVDKYPRLVPPHSISTSRSASNLASASTHTRKLPHHDDADDADDENHDPNESIAASKTKPPTLSTSHDSNSWSIWKRQRVSTMSQISAIVSLQQPFTNSQSYSNTPSQPRHTISPTNSFHNSITFDDLIAVLSNHHKSNRQTIDQLVSSLLPCCTPLTYHTAYFHLSTLLSRCFPTSPTTTDSDHQLTSVLTTVKLSIARIFHRGLCAQQSERKTTTMNESNADSSFPTAHLVPIHPLTLSTFTNPSNPSSSKPMDDIDSQNESQQQHEQQVVLLYHCHSSQTHHSHTPAQQIPTTNNDQSAHDVYNASQPPQSSSATSDFPLIFNPNLSLLPTPPAPLQTNSTLPTPSLPSNQDSIQTAIKTLNQCFTSLQSSSLNVNLNDHLDSNARCRKWKAISEQIRKDYPT